MFKKILVLIVCSITFFGISPALAIGFDAENVYNSVFVISSGEALGSGFAIGSNTIITNAHVIDDEHNVSVQSYGGEHYSASVYSRDEYLDLALLIVQDSKFTPLELVSLDSAKIGDDIYTVGIPNSMAYTLTKGVISSKSRELSGQKYIQIDAPINEGNSGGPLLNDSGAVLGINTLKLMESEGIGFAIPSETVRDYLTETGVLLTETGTIDPSWMPNPDEYVEETPNSDFNIGSKTDVETKILYEKNPVNVVIIACLALSVLVNIILLLFIKHEKTDKHNDLKKESMDFEIDIEE